MAQRRTSFSQKVKDELFRTEPQNICCYRSELAAFIHLRGYITIKDGKRVLTILTDNSSSARYIFKLLKKLLMISPEILYRESKKYSRSGFMIRLEDEAAVKKILNYLGVDKDEGWYTVPRVNPELIKNECCQKSYLRGGFIAGGSINYPDTSYHLEIFSEHEVYAHTFHELMKGFGINSAIRVRKKGYYIYLKNSESIMDFLRAVKAYDIIFQLEEKRVFKSLRNQTNRIVNCDTANMEKAITAGEQQLRSISIINRQIGLNNLSPSLVEAAKVRIDNTDMSLKELGELLNPPVSKSGMSYRMNKINRIAELLQKKQ